MRRVHRAKGLMSEFSFPSNLQTVLSNLRLPNSSMDLESIDSAISDLINPRFFVFSPLCLRASVVKSSLGAYGKRAMKGGRTPERCVQES